MKKFLLITIIVLMISGMLASCNTNISTGTNSNINNEVDERSDTGSNGDSDTSNDSNTDTNIIVGLYEKYGNKVYFANEGKDIYYPEIREYEKVSNCFDIPKDANGLKKVGAYLKFIKSYEDLLTYIIPVEFDSSIFDLNYVVCVKQFFYDDAHKKRLIGYYDLACSDGKYIISLDYYKSVDQVPHAQTADPYELTTYITVPKNSVVFTEYLQQITVNGRNDIEDEIYVDNDGYMDFVEDDGKQIAITTNPPSLFYITHNVSIVLPENPTAWIVEKGSMLEKSYSLEYYNKYNEINFRAILYLPNEPKYDFIITEKVIKNGNLYLTVENYTQYTNEYLNKNDVKFYDLYIQDTSELAENFDVYILVKTVK